MKKNYYIFLVVVVIIFIIYLLFNKLNDYSIIVNNIITQHELANSRNSSINEYKEYLKSDTEIIKDYNQIIHKVYSTKDEALIIKEIESLILKSKLKLINFKRNLKKNKNIISCNIVVSAKGKIENYFKFTELLKNSKKYYQISQLELNEVSNEKQLSINLSIQTIMYKKEKK